MENNAIKNTNSVSSVIETTPAIIRYVNVNDVHMDTYQRPVQMHKVLAIKNEFNIHRNRPIELSYRDGKYWCWDGQHRLAAHKLLGLTRINAQVHYGLTKEQESKLFADQHRNETCISKAAEWHSRVEAGKEDPETQNIIKILAERGYTIVQKQSKKPKEIAAIAAVQGLYRRHGERGLIDVMWVIDTAWGGQEASVNKKIFSGFDRMLQFCTPTNDQWNRIVACLSKITPRELLHSATVMGSGGGKSVAAEILHLHNKGLKRESKNRMPEIYR